MEIGTLEFLMKAQKNHLAYLSRTRVNGRFVPPRVAGHPTRIFQPWPTGQKSAAQKRRCMKGMSMFRSFPKRSRMDNMDQDPSVSLPVESNNQQPKLPSETKTGKDIKEIAALLENKAVIPPTKLLPGGKKPLQTVDLTLDYDDSNNNSALEQPSLDQSGLDQSIQSHLIDLDQSALDELPSEASFSRYLEDRPDTACSTPAKPDSSSGDMNTSITQQGKTPKRQLAIISQSGNVKTLKNHSR